MTGALMFLYSLIIIISLTIILAILYSNKKRKFTDKKSTRRILAINKMVLGAVVVIFIIGIVLLYSYFAGITH